MQCWHIFCGVKFSQRSYFQQEKKFWHGLKTPDAPVQNQIWGTFFKTKEGLCVLFGMETFICFVLCLNSVSVMLCYISEEGWITENLDKYSDIVSILLKLHFCSGILVLKHSQKTRNRSTVLQDTDFLDFLPMYRLLFFVLFGPLLFAHHRLPSSSNMTDLMTTVGRTYQNMCSFRYRNLYMLCIMS